MQPQKNRKSQDRLNKVFKSSAVKEYSTSRYGKFGCGTVYFSISVFFVQEPNWSMQGSELCCVEPSMKSVNISKSVPLFCCILCKLLPTAPSLVLSDLFHTSLFFFFDDFHFPEILILFPVK